MAGSRSWVSWPRIAGGLDSQEAGPFQGLLVLAEPLTQLPFQRGEVLPPGDPFTPLLGAELLPLCCPRQPTFQAQ